MKLNMNENGIVIEASKIINMLSKLLVFLLLFSGVSALVLLIKFLITKIIGG